MQDIFMTFKTNGETISFMLTELDGHPTIISSVSKEPPKTILIEESDMVDIYQRLNALFQVTRKGVRLGELVCLG
jgi:hypothetical protein|tara:strand:+ start:761 stop:985 length:225 start_codon:yes stop_codon:yes gene_type:complete